MGSELTDWRRITPASLTRATNVVRETYKRSSFRCRLTTAKLCYLDLHPELVDRTSFTPYQSNFLRYFSHLDRKFIRRFEAVICTETASAIFRAYFDALQELVARAVERVFKKTVQIGVANPTGLGRDPIEWAQIHSRLLIDDELEPVKHWIKNACDEQDLLAATEPTQDPTEWFLWKTWRAPRLVSMQPSGNLPYDAGTEWIREDEAGTLRLLEGHAQTFVTLLGSRLGDIAGEAYVQSAIMGQPDARGQNPGATRVLTKRKTGKGARRRAVIFAAIQAGLKGPKYCRYLDDAGVTPRWDGCPKTYYLAYKVGEPWRKKIHDEKHRSQVIYDRLSPAERERLIQAVTR